MKVTELTKRISEEKFVQAYRVIIEMAERGEKISFFSVSEKAEVSRQFLYNHSELRELIRGMRITTLKKRELQQEILRLRLRVHELEVLLQPNEEKGGNPM